MGIKFQTNYRKLRGYYPKGRKAKRGYRDRMGTYHPSKRSCANANFNW